MFEEDGSLDPLLKFLLYAFVAVGVGKVLWNWLAHDLGRWITVDLWGVIGNHPWWCGFIVAGLAAFLLTVGWLSSRAATRHLYVGPYAGHAKSEDTSPAELLTFKMKELASMTPTGFEQACADLLVRDGFRRPRRVGGAGDLGVDVIAHDDEDRLLILQCKQYQKPVGSGHVQQFNGTARPHHGADLPIMIALSGFTRPAIDFAQHHDLRLVGRLELKKWAHGQHLYDVLGLQSTTP